MSEVIGLDIRRDEELKANPAPGSLHIEMNSVLEELPKKITDKNQEILIFCEAGGRASIVKGQLEGLGYTNLRNIGSWREWNELSQN